MIIRWTLFTAIKNKIFLSNKRNPKSAIISMILFSMILAYLLIIPVLATDSQAGNNAIPFQTITGTSLSSTIQENINDAIAEKIAIKNKIDQDIVEREIRLSESFLKNDDSHSAQILSLGLKVHNPYETTPTSSMKLSSPENYGQDIPVGGYVEFGVDSRTRIFSEDGTQISYSDDNKIDKTMIHSGVTEPTTHSISVPSGSTVNDNGEFIHVIYKDKILVTIINKKYNSFPNYHSDDLTNSSTKERSFFPSIHRNGGTWVADAAFTPHTELHAFNAQWTIPHSEVMPQEPNLNSNYMSSDTNFIFNGIEPLIQPPSSTIIQPVTAYNYKDFNSDGVAWQNSWFGSAYIVKTVTGDDGLKKELAIHSTPISLNEGNNVQGFMYFINDPDEWVILLTENGRVTQNNTYVFYHIPNQTTNIDPKNVILYLTYEAMLLTEEVDPYCSQHGTCPPIMNNQAKCSNIKFSDIKVWNASIHEISPVWIGETTPNTSDHWFLTDIYVDNITQAPSRVTIYTTPPSAPGADFEADTATTGTAPVAVAFRDISTNTPTSRSWDFGDGTISTEKNPVHMYTSSGTYDVSLTATNSAGSSTTTRSELITVDSPLPNERVTNGNCDSTTAWLTEGSAGNGGSWYPAQYVSSDGQSGGYLRLDVNGDTSGWANSAMYQDIDFTNVDTLTYYLRTIGSTTAGSKTIDVYLDNTLIRTIPSPSGLTLWKQYSDPVSGLSGIHRIKFYTSVSNSGSSGWMKVGVDSVSASAQVTTASAEFTGNQTSGIEPFTVSFTDASANNPTAWAWDFGDESTSVERNPSHTYISAGTFTVILTVANSAGSNTNIKTGYITANPQMFSIATSAGSGGDITPSGSVNVIRGESQMFFITHYAGYDINKVFVDGVNQGAISMYSFSDVQSAHTIYANFRRNLLPVSNFTANVTTGLSPLTVQFTDTSTGSPTLWNWSFGNGKFSNQQYPTNTYYSNRSYSVSLTVSNGVNSTTTKTNFITVYTLPTKIGVFRNSTKLWPLDSNGNGIWDGTPTDRLYTFGLSTDAPVTGDWNGDGKSEISVFRNNTWKWQLDSNGNGIWDGTPTDTLYRFGLSSDVPVTGDWNGDGKSEIGIFRNNTRQWLLDYNGNGIWDGTPTDTLYTFGLSTDAPVTGDWNGDGKSEIGVFRNSTQKWRLDSNGNGIWDGIPTDRLYTFGLSTDAPVTGDWNGDGKTEIGVFRNSTQQWLLDYNGNGIWDGTPMDMLYTFGRSTDIPVSGKWS
jgi:PKD repeat protein